MQPEAREMARLWDMLDAEQTVLEFISDMHVEDFLQDRKTRNAVERNLEIVGEAARRVSTETRDEHPDTPWKPMIGLRNVLAHEYDAIRHEILWRICRRELPLLIRLLEEMGVDDPPAEEGQ